MYTISLQRVQFAYLFVPKHLGRSPDSNIEGKDDVIAVDVVIMKNDGLFVNKNLVDVNRLAEASFPRMFVQFFGNHVPNQDNPFGFVATENNLIASCGLVLS